MRVLSAARACLIARSGQPSGGRCSTSTIKTKKNSISPLLLSVLLLAAWRPASSCRTENPRPWPSSRPMAAESWTLIETKEAGHALFFLDETSGWMVTPSGIWFTDECGRTWRRIHKQRGLTDIRFVSPDRGWAIGANKTVIETTMAARPGKR